MRKNCPNCSAPVQAATLDKVSGADGGYTLSGFGLPVAKCAKGHASPVDNDFMIWLIGELKEKEAGMPAAEEKGMLFKKHFCACGKELAGKAEGAKAFVHDMAYEGSPAFRMQIDAPVYRCPGCGKEQVASHKRLRSHVSQALANLSDAAGFPHSG